MISPYIVTIIASWLVAQGAKYVVAVIKNRTFRAFRHFYISGNMPSAHSATVVSVATLIGCREGFGSAIFGLALTLAGIVMYDAVMVRRSVGEQGLAIRAIIEAAHNKLLFPRSAKGHTPVEVLVGAGVGVVIGYVVFIATR